MRAIDFTIYSLLVAIGGAVSGLVSSVISADIVAKICLVGSVGAIMFAMAGIAVIISE